MLSIVDKSAIKHIKDMVEKLTIEKAPSRLALLGCYVITPEIFSNS